MFIRNSEFSMKNPLEETYYSEIIHCQIDSSVFFNEYFRLYSKDPGNFSLNLTLYALITMKKFQIHRFISTKVHWIIICRINFNELLEETLF